MKNGNTFVLNLAEYEAPKVVEDRQKEYVTFGKNNSYYQFLIERYKNSTTNNAVINAITHLIYGRGLSALDASKKPNEYAQMVSMLGTADVRQIVADFYMLGQCAIQVHYDDKHTRIVKAYHIPVQLLAPEKCDKDGQINSYFYSDNWENLREFPATPIPAFGKSKEKIEILFVKPYAVGMKYFAYPMYQGGLPYANLEEEISRYLTTRVRKSFSGTKVINIFGDYTADQQRITSDKIKENCTGADGDPVIVSFSGDEKLKTTIDEVQLDNAADQYTYLSTECTEKILLSHKVVSGLIFGVAKSSGFSSNADELKTATTLFDNMVIRPIQDKLIEAFDQLLAFNQISLKLYFKTLQPLEFIDLENAQTADQVAEKTGTELSEQIDLSQFGEEVNPDWILIDEFEVDYDSDEKENELLSKEPEVKLSLAKQFINLISTGDARPNIRSKQDEVINGIKFITRYVYAGQDGGKSKKMRPFCTQMQQLGKVYRKEDIQLMSSQAVNPGFGPKGTNTYDIFLYKGGANCYHRWNKQVYATLEGTALNVFDKKTTKQIAVKKAEKLGYVVKNNPLVSTRPIDTPTRGYLPKNN